MYYLYSSSSDVDLEVKIADRHVKFLNSETLNNFFKGHILKKKVDVPLIIIYSYSEDYILKLLYFLSFKFRNDGYYSAGIYNKPIALLYGLEYIPIINSWDINQFKDKIEALHRSYNFDIIILGIVVNQEKTIIYKMNSILKPDINILNFNSYIQKILSDEDLPIEIDDISNLKNKFGSNVVEDDKFHSLYHKILNILIPDKN
ncbi:hypothetical protein SAMN04487886_11281 [Clostridium sp. DSM 8431]|nr:hypothetical protein SAMN04487886_11281 [Clostridium sp. DSM 8431]